MTDRLIYVCGCGCTTFELMTNPDALVCANCGDLQTGEEWVKFVPPKPKEPPTRDDSNTIRTTFTGHPEFAKRSVFAKISRWFGEDELAILAGWSKDDGASFWININNEEQREWAVRRIQELMDHLKMKKM